MSYASYRSQFATLSPLYLGTYPALNDYDCSLVHYVIHRFWPRKAIRIGSDFISQEVEQPSPVNTVNSQCINIRLIG
jgi:hypothetical protein